MTRHNIMNYKFYHVCPFCRDLEALCCAYAYTTSKYITLLLHILCPCRTKGEPADYCSLWGGLFTQLAIQLSWLVQAF